MADNVVQIIIRAKDEASGTLDRFEGNLKGLTTGVLAAAGIFAAAGGALVSFATQAAQRANDFKVAGEKIGETTEEVSRLSFAAEQADVPLESFSQGLKFIQRNAADAVDGTGDAAAAFRSLGIDVKNASGELKPAGELLLEVADRFSKIENGSTKTALAIKLFGRAGADMIPILNQGRDGIEALKRKSDELGITVSTTAGILGDEFGDQLAALRQQIEGLKSRIAEALLPQMIELVKRAQVIVAEFITWTEAHRPLIRALLDTGVQAGQLIAVIAAVTTALAGLRVAFGATSIAALAASRGGIAALGVALGFLLLKLNEAHEKALEPFQLGPTDLSTLDAMEAALKKFVAQKVQLQNELAKAIDTNKPVSGAGPLGKLPAFQTNEQQTGALKEQIAEVDKSISTLLQYIEVSKDAAGATTSLGSTARKTADQLEAERQALINTLLTAPTDAEKRIAALNAALGELTTKLPDDVRIKIALDVDKALADAKALREQLTTELDVPPLQIPEPDQGSIQEFLRAIGRGDEDIEAFTDKLIALHSAGDDMAAGLAGAFEVFRQAAETSLNSTIVLARDAGAALVDFTDDLSTKFGEALADLTGFGERTFKSLGDFIDSIDKLIHQLIRSIIAAIAKALVLKAVLGIFGGPKIPGFESSGTGFAATGGEIGPSGLASGGSSIARFGAFLASGGEIVPRAAGLARSVAATAAISAATFAPALAKGGELVDIRYVHGASGFVVPGSGEGQDRVPALLAAHEVVLPTIAGIQPATLLRGLFDGLTVLKSGKAATTSTSANDELAREVKGLRNDLRQLLGRPQDPPQVTVNVTPSPAGTRAEVRGGALRRELDLYRELRG